MSDMKTTCYYEPELDRTYGYLATHYGDRILPEDLTCHDNG